MSKGDKQRPMNVTYKKYGDSWDKIFGKRGKHEITGEIESTMMDNSEAMEGIIKNVANQIKDEVDEEIIEEVVKKDIRLLHDRSLECEFERLKTGHA